MNDRIIKFPGVRSTKVGPPEGDKPGRVENETPPARVEKEIAHQFSAQSGTQLTEDQQKAIGLILRGTTFVFLGIKPTESGADFFTALHGDADDLRNAEQELPAVIARLYARKGIRE